MNWINVNDRLPKDGQTGIILWKTDHNRSSDEATKPGFNSTVGYFRDGEFRTFTFNEDNVVKNVSHWSEIIPPMDILTEPNINHSDAYPVIYRNGKFLDSSGDTILAKDDKHLNKDEIEAHYKKKNKLASVRDLFREAIECLSSEPDLEIEIGPNLKIVDNSISAAFDPFGKYPDEGINIIIKARNKTLFELKKIGGLK